MSGAHHSKGSNQDIALIFNSLAKMNKNKYITEVKL